MNRLFVLGCAAALSYVASNSTTIAAPRGGFAAVLDQSTNNTDSRKSVIFFDTADMSAPLFGVFVGQEVNSFENPDAITVDPNTGDVYVLAVDGGSATGPPAIELDGDLDTLGDFDLLRVDFQGAYAHWEMNFKGQGTGGSNLYATYGDGSSAFDVSHTNPQASPAFIDKIGEIARSPGDGFSFFNTRLEFIDQQTLVYIDANTGSAGDVQDLQIRSIQKVSGPATVSGTEGGYNNNTSEAWESSILGYVNLDGANTSEAVSIAAVRNQDGVTGLWILEDDGAGDNVAFYEITNFDGIAGNAYRDINFAGGPENRFSVDDNPFVDPTLDDGSGDQVLVDHNTGDLVIVESGFFDSPTHEPKVFKLLIDTYDNGSDQIDADFLNGATNDGFTPNQMLDVSAIYNDGGALIDGRNAIFDWINNDVYFYDEDGFSDTQNGGASFLHDWYKLDLDTGVTSIVGADADAAGLFSSSGRANDQVEFFYIIPEPTTTALALSCAVASLVRVGRARNCAH